MANKPKPTGNRPNTQDPYENPALAIGNVIISNDSEISVIVAPEARDGEIEKLKQALLACFKQEGVTVEFKERGYAEEDSAVIKLTFAIENKGGKSNEEISDICESIMAASEEISPEERKR